MARKSMNLMVIFMAVLLAAIPAWSLVSDQTNPTCSGQDITPDMTPLTDYTVKAEILLARGGNGGGNGGQGGNGGGNGGQGGNGGGNGGQGGNGDGDGSCDGDGDGPSASLGLGPGASASPGPGTGVGPGSNSNDE